MISYEYWLSLNKNYVDGLFNIFLDTLNERHGIDSVSLSTKYKFSRFVYYNSERLKCI